MSRTQYKLWQCLKQNIIIKVNNKIKVNTLVISKTKYKL